MNDVRTITVTSPSHPDSLSGDKRSSTGNLFFTDQFDNHPWEAPPDIEIKTPAWPARRRNLSCQEEARRGGQEVEVRDPAATLQAMAGQTQFSDYKIVGYEETTSPEVLESKKEESYQQIV